MALKIQTEDLAERQKQLIVEVPADQIEAAMHRAARQLSKRSHIAGFRPGKAPYEVIVQRYGEEAIFDEALDALGPDVYRQALENTELDPIAPGSFDDVVSRKPLVLRYTVPLRPSIDLGTYRDLRLPFPEPEVGDAAVEEVLDGLRQQQAVIEPVDRPAQDSDVIVLDVRAELHQAAAPGPNQKREPETGNAEDPADQLEPGTEAGGSKVTVGESPVTQSSEPEPGLERGGSQGEAEGPAQSRSPEGSEGAVVGPALSRSSERSEGDAEGPALSAVEGPALSAVEGPALSAVEGTERPLLMDERGLSLLLSETTDFPFPGVAAHLLGMQAGDDKDLDHTFPSDYRNESLRGRSASFHVRCQSVKSRLVPEWSDDLARTLGEFNDLLDLRLKVRQSLEAQSRRQAESDYADKMVEAVVAGASIVYPPVLLKQEIDDTLHDLDHRLKDQRLSLAEYLKIEKKEEQELRKELEPQARRRLERALVLGEVVEAEGLEVDEPEVAAAIARIVEPLKESGAGARRALESPAGRRRIALDLLTDKAVARLVQTARGEAPPLALRNAEGPALSNAEGPALSNAEGPALRNAEGPALRNAEGPAAAPQPIPTQGEGES